MTIRGLALPCGRAARALLLGCALALPAQAAEFAAVAEQDFLAARRVAAAASEASGHRIVWLSPAIGLLPDIYFVSHSRAREMAGRGMLATIALPGDRAGRLAPLLSLPAAGEGEVFALPLPVELPVLQADPRMLEARRLELPTEPGWGKIADLATALVDPLGGVHGICIDPAYGHAEVLLSMALAAGASPAEPFVGERWLAQAEAYARLLASAGPPEAARLSDGAYRDLEAAGRCALRLAPLAGIDPGQGPLAAVPSAAAFVDPARTMIAVSSEAPHRGRAADFAWELMSAGSAAAPEGIGGDMDALGERPAEVRAAVAAMLRQEPTRRAGDLDWRRLAAEAQAPLADLVDGLIPADEALEQAAAAADRLRAAVAEIP